MESENTNWVQSVGAVVIQNGQVLLVRHTYGAGKGKLIIPGGYVLENETPQDAVRREVLEETGIFVEPLDIIGIRFNNHDWYVIFTARYLSGKARSDQKENSEAVWMRPEEALTRDDVPDLTKKVLQALREGGPKLSFCPYDGDIKRAPFSLYL